jgi:hypothetical protein
MATKSWSDLSPGGRVALIVLSAIQIGLLAAALWDVAHRTPEEIRGDRRMWAGIAFINWIGPLAYFTIGRKDGLSGLMEQCRALTQSCRKSEAAEA